MDVLIVETDQLIGTMLAEALAEDGITAAVMPDEEALALPPSDAPLAVITGMNRGHQEDMAGLQTVRALRNKWPALGAVYMAARWPARLCRNALTARDRFLTKPAPLINLIRTVRELFSGATPCQSR